LWRDPAPHVVRSFHNDMKIGEVARLCHEVLGIVKRDVLSDRVEWSADVGDDRPRSQAEPVAAKLPPKGALREVGDLQAADLTRIPRRSKSTTTACRDSRSAAVMPKVCEPALFAGSSIAVAKMSSRVSARRPSIRVRKILPAAALSRCVSARVATCTTNSSPHSRQSMASGSTTRQRGPDKWLSTSRRYGEYVVAIHLMMSAEYHGIPAVGSK